MDREVGAELLARLAQVVEASSQGSVESTLNSVADVADLFISESIAATVVLVDGNVSSGLRLAACSGLSRHYIDVMQADPDQFRASAPARAIRAQQPVLVPDLFADESYSRWWDMARGEGYRSILATPMFVGGAAIGSLNIYRRVAGDLSEYDFALLELFTRVASGVLESSLLLADRDQQVAALGRLVQVLQDQAHEHANRLQAIRGLIAIGAADEAVDFIWEVSETYASHRSEITERIAHATLAGLLVALAAVAAQRGITLELDPRSRLIGLPANLTDSQLVSLVGNLLDNAMSAVAEEEPDRRVIRIAVVEAADTLTIEVKDRGRGLAMPIDEALTRGRSSKPEHLGAGLALVNKIVRSAMGVLEVSHTDGGTAFVITIPLMERRALPL